MTPRQFDWLLQARGPALSLWPAQDRVDAFCLLRGNARARAMLAASLEAETLEAADAASDDEAALARIAGRVRQKVVIRSTTAPALRWGVRGGALAACLIAGLWAGGALGTSEHDPLGAVQVAALDNVQ